MQNLGKEVPQEELIDVFPAKEGEGNLYYGLIGYVYNLMKKKKAWR